MRKLIAGINMTVDGFCDHTSAVADDELHEHYNDLVRNAGVMIWGRTTFQLMESYWPSLVNNPSGNKPMDEFAALIDDLPKIVYSRTLGSVDWKNTTLKNELIKEEIEELKRQDGKDIYVGSPSMIVAFSDLGVVDEYQLCIHPVVVGSGLPLFKHLQKKIDLTLVRTKPFASGAVVHYYRTKGEHHDS